MLKEKNKIFGTYICVHFKFKFNSILYQIKSKGKMLMSIELNHEIFANIWASNLEVLIS